jgi:hypothetical protein
MLAASELKRSPEASMGQGNVIEHTNLGKADRARSGN